MRVARLHLEFVVARRKIGISHRPVASVDLDPIAVEPLQAVSIAILLRVGEVQGREFEGEDVLPMVEGQFVGLGYRPLEGRGEVGSLQRSRFVEQAKRGNGHRRRFGVAFNLIWEKGIQPGGPAEKHLTPWTLKVGTGRKDFPL